MCLGKKRYGDFQNSPEGIPTNILANRLWQLNGLTRKNPCIYEYVLTAKGAERLPVLQTLVRWIQRYDVDCWAPPEVFFAAKPEDLLENRVAVGFFSASPEYLLENRVTG